MPTSPNGMMDAVLANLEAKSGHPPTHWIAVLREQFPEVAAGNGVKRKDRIDWLKREHGLGHVTAAILVDKATEPDDYEEPSDAALLEAQYAGAKAALRPIHDRLIELARGLGVDVRIEARQTYVSLARIHQFAVIQPSTRTRVDLGLKLGDTPATDRLQPAGSFGSGNTSHRVALTSPADVDAEVLGWLQDAYSRIK